MTENLQDHPVLVVDFGAQYAQLIARRVREARIYSEVVPHTITAEEVRAKSPAAIVLSGGPASVYAEDAPSLDPAVFDLGVPVFGICYGFQAMADKLGGEVANTGGREFGRTTFTTNGEGVLHQGLSDTQPVWMSHNDAVQSPPEGFTVTGSTPGAPVASFENLKRRMAGVQYHPEVLHTPHGQQILTRFLYEIAGLEATWTAANIADALIDAVADQIGDGRAICGLSGGVDSAVAAALVQRAIGDRLTCVFVDHGLLRAGEREQVQHDFVGATGAKLVTVDAADTFLRELSGVSDPETKRKIIGREFIRTFEQVAAELVREAFGTAGVLLSFVGERRVFYKAQRGANGAGDWRNGARGEDLVLEVPVGTVVRSEDGEVLADLTVPGTRFIAAEGGFGGLGNAALASATSS